MQAIPSTYQEIARSNRQLLIPLYQRHYRWGPKQFAALFEDILRQYRSVMQYRGLSEEEQSKLVGSHYMGAIVLKQSEENSDEWDVIDGQQRLTTVTLLLAALRDTVLPITAPGRRPTSVDPDIRDLRKNFNSTYFVTPPTRPGQAAKPRIIPQKRDEVPFNAILNWSDPTQKLDPRSLGHNEPSNVFAAYRYFKRVLRMTPQKAEADDSLAPYAELFPLDAELVQAIAATRLLFIEVRTTSVDDANAIFESLNFKVVALGAVDLLKNYLFMLLRSEATRLLDEWWNPSVRQIGGNEKDLAGFVLNDLVSRGVATSRTALYETKQTELRNVYAKGGSDALWAELTRMRVSLATYLEASDPANHSTRSAVKRALQAVHEARGSTAVPLLMYILRTADDEGIDDRVVIDALRLVESYLIRRLLAGEDAHNLNSYFSSMLVRALGRDADAYASMPFYDRVAAILDSTGKDWPSDERIAEAILLGDFYHRGESGQRMLVFRRLDHEYGQGLTVDYADSNIEVEHVYPQGAEEATGHWAAAAKAAHMSVQEFQRRYLHSLANVVPLLKAENLAASNNPFPEKVAVYAQSSVKMTKWVADAFGQGAVWGEPELKSRATDLATKAIAAWPKPAVALPIPPAATVDGADQQDDEDDDLGPLVDDTLEDEGVTSPA